jgi:hypothetical protein
MVGRSTLLRLMLVALAAVGLCGHGPRPLRWKRRYAWRKF